MQAGHCRRDDSIRKALCDHDNTINSNKNPQAGRGGTCPDVNPRHLGGGDRRTMN